MDFFKVFSKGDGTLIGHAYLASGGTAIDQCKLVLVQSWPGLDTSSEDEGGQCETVEESDAPENTGHLTSVSDGYLMRDHIDELHYNANDNNTDNFETSASLDTNSNDQLSPPVATSSPFISSLPVDATKFYNLSEVHAQHNSHSNKVTDMEALEKPSSHGFERICWVKLDEDKNLIKVTSVSYLQPPDSKGYRRSISTKKELEAVLLDYQDLTIPNFSFSREIFGLNTDFEIVKETSKVSYTQKDRQSFKNPANLTKFVKFLRSGDVRKSLALCYMCNKTLSSSMIGRHMAHHHLGKDTCYRCGIDRSGTNGKHFCDENKVEKEGEIELKQGESKCFEESKSYMKVTREKVTEAEYPETTGNSEHSTVEEEVAGSKHPEKLSKFVKILGRNDRGKMLALCYMCNKVLRYDSLRMHMVRFHLPQGTCYRCGEDRTEDYKKHLENCDENKVEKQEHQFTEILEPCENKQEDTAVAREDEGGVTSQSSNGDTVEQSCDEEFKKNKEMEDNSKKIEVTNEVHLEDENDMDIIPVWLTLCMEGHKKVRIMTKSNVHMIKIMRGFGKKTGLNWRTLKFVEQKEKEVKEVQDSDKAGDLVDGIVMVQKRNIV